MNSVHNHVLSSEKRAEKCASEVLDRIEKFSDPELGHFKVKASIFDILLVVFFFVASHSRSIADIIECSAEKMLLLVGQMSPD